MTAMYMLIAFSLVIATGFVLAFVWAIRSGQYDDKYTPSVRVLFDDERLSASKMDPKDTLSNRTDSNLDSKENTPTQTTN
jgi:cbb3-type cytochrome oxidase maturation protein